MLADRERGNEEKRVVGASVVDDSGKGSARLSILRLILGLSHLDWCARGVEEQVLANALVEIYQLLPAPHSSTLRRVGDHI